MNVETDFLIDVVPVSECAEILGADRNRITRLVLRNDTRR